LSRFRKYYIIFIVIEKAEFHDDGDDDDATALSFPRFIEVNDYFI